MSKVTCERCDDKGEYPAANGPDDFEMVFCSCDKGREQEALNERLNDQFKRDDMEYDEIAAKIASEL